MGALIGRQRKFVEALMTLGADSAAIRQAAIMAGYSPNHGYHMMQDDRVMAAVRELATKTVAGSALIGVKVMVEIATTAGHKDQFQAAKHLAALNGFTAEQRIVVEHLEPDKKALIIEVRELANQLGMDPRTLIESTGLVIDAEFEEVAAVDDSDW